MVDGCEVHKSLVRSDATISGRDTRFRLIELYGE